jgi:hypothetical protein
MENSFSFYQDQRKGLLSIWPPINGETFAKVLETISNIWQRFNKLFHYA